MSDLAYYLRISNHLAGKLDIRSALRSIKAEVGKIIDIDHLDVCLIDDDKMCNTSYEVGLRTAWSTSKSLISLSPVRDILTGQTDTLVTGNAIEDPRYVFPGSASDPIRRHKLRSRVNVAMKVLGRTIGSLNCSSFKQDFYHAGNVEQVRTIADILAPYFFALQANEKARREAVFRAEIQAREEGLRVGALSLTQELEAERRRIGMDLHDQTLADLTRIARDIRPGLSSEQHELIQARIQTTIQGLRDIIDTSTPSILELFGFQHAVLTHLERSVSVDGGVSYDVADNTNGAIDRLPAATQTAIFRICQEAVNNAVLHSGASNISVAARWREAGTIEVRISDNGHFKPGAKKPGGGLTHMGIRARLIGAEYKMEKTRGTCVTVCFPSPQIENPGP